MNEYVEYRNHSNELNVTIWRIVIVHIKLYIIIHSANKKSNYYNSRIIIVPDMVVTAAYIVVIAMKI